MKNRNINLVIYWANMDIEKYMKERVDAQIIWHDQKSNCNKWAYIVFSVVAIVGSITAGITIHYCKMIATILSALVAISVGLNNLLKFQEKWTLYRATSELLKSEKLKFKVNAGEYGNTDSEKLFYDKIESILNNTNQKWLQFFDKETD